MKKLYEFTINKDVEVEEISDSIVDGQEVKITKKVTKSVPQKFFLRKPNRSMIDEAELFHGVSLAQGIRAGLMTRTMLAKRFNNDGGVLSESEKSRIEGVWTKLSEKEMAYQKLKLKEDKTPEDTAAINTLLIELSDLRIELQSFQNAQAALFEETAEIRARNKTIVWWITKLAYSEDEKGHKMFFEHDDHAKALVKYEELEELGDPFINLALKYFNFLVSFWYVGRANTKEDFDAALPLINSIET